MTVRSYLGFDLCEVRQWLAGRHPALSVAQATLISDKTQPTKEPTNGRGSGEKDEHTTDLGKLTSAYRVLEASGAGVAFTLIAAPMRLQPPSATPRALLTTSNAGSAGR